MSQTARNEINVSLSSLALLSVQFKEGKDYLDYLYGFVIGVLIQVGGEPFDALTVQKLVEQHFGLRIPAATFAVFLKRLAKAGVVATASTDVQFRVVRLPASTIDGERELVKASIAEVTDELAGFAYSRYGLKWDERDSSPR